MRDYDAFTSMHITISRHAIIRGHTVDLRINAIPLTFTDQLTGLSTSALEADVFDLDEQHVASSTGKLRYVPVVLCIVLQRIKKLHGFSVCCTRVTVVNEWFCLCVKNYRYQNGVTLYVVQSTFLRFFSIVPGLIVNIAPLLLFKSSLKTV